jgi:alkylated DNA repair dioxygenase AlkB
MARLVQTLPLRAETLVLFGQRKTTPRLTSWHGDPHARYAYSGRGFEPAPWTDELASLRERLRAATGIRYSGVLANYYRDGSDSMGWHADDERELGPSPDDIRVASISLGAPRRFVLRARDDRSHRLEFPLGHGDLLVMGGTTQRHFVHAVPKTARVVGPRLNLTFRVVGPAR